MHVNSENLILNKFLEEVEHYMWISMLAAKAKRDLNIIVIKSNKSVNKYYYWLFKLWEDANTSMDAHMEKFKLTLKLSIFHLLLAEKYNSMRKLLSVARSIEEQKQKISNNFPRDLKPSQKLFKL